MDWAAVLARKYRPPFLPKLTEPGDDRHFDKYRDPGFKVEPYDSKLYGAFHGF